VFKQIYLFNPLFPYFFSIQVFLRDSPREINNVGYDNDHLIREIKIVVTTPVTDMDDKIRFEKVISMIK
jgi:hypothetical protein